ncbi:MAG: sulfite exporter TauE/SafE family protein, partial [Polyangiales bacterium]
GRDGGPTPARATGLRTGTYLATRAASYAVLGASVAFAGRPLLAMLPARSVLGVTTALVSIALLLRAIELAGLRVNSGLVTLRRKPIAARWLRRLGPQSPAVLGLLTAMLPCGALASAVLAAGSTGEPLLAAAMMATFALASAPALAATVSFGAAWSRLSAAHPGLRSASAMMLVALAAWLTVTPWIASIDGRAATGHCARCAH